MKETKELVVGLLALSAMLAEVFKDGVQVADIGAVLAKVQANPELSAKLVAAYQDIELVKAETKEVSAAEVFEIVAAALPELQNLIAAVKK